MPVRAKAATAKAKQGSLGPPACQNHQKAMTELNGGQRPAGSSPRRVSSCDRWNTNKKSPSIVSVAAWWTAGATVTAGTEPEMMPPLCHLWYPLDRWCRRGKNKADHLTMAQLQLRRRKNHFCRLPPPPP
jgi:hypothetical protein